MNQYGRGLPSQENAGHVLNRATSRAFPCLETFEYSNKSMMPLGVCETVPSEAIGAGVCKPVLAGVSTPSDTCQRRWCTSDRLRSYMTDAPEFPKDSTSLLMANNPYAKSPLYKTEMCRTWKETGTCRYGKKCQFAHGQLELRPVQRHPKYKTQLCRTYAVQGFCPYGHRCRFIHAPCHGPNASSAPMSFGPDPAGLANAVPPQLPSQVPNSASYGIMAASGFYGKAVTASAPMLAAPPVVDGSYLRTSHFHAMPASDNRALCSPQYSTQHLLPVHAPTQPISTPAPAPSPASSHARSASSSLSAPFASSCTGSSDAENRGSNVQFDTPTLLPSSLLADISSLGSATASIKPRKLQTVSTQTSPFKSPADALADLMRLSTLTHSQSTQLTMLRQALSSPGFETRSPFGSPGAQRQRAGSGYAPGALEPYAAANAAKPGAAARSAPGCLPDGSSAPQLFSSLQT